MNQEQRRASNAAADPSTPAPTAVRPDELHEARDDSARPAALFHDEEATGFQSRWEAIQTGFVDEPRAAVEQADALVAQVATRLTDVFGEERMTLEQQWDRGDNVSTEDLRMALKRYRSFFDRLLSI